MRSIIVIRRALLYDQSSEAVNLTIHRNIYGQRFFRLYILRNFYVATKSFVFYYKCPGKMKFLRACIVGSGPSGFYTAKMLMKLYQNVKVDMFESLPVPFGLVRYGVAPDHVNVKNVENTFRGIASDERFSFYGNVTIGNNRIATREFNNKVSVEELKKWYSVIVFCVGASGEKKLNLPGEQLQHVYTSSSFVDWYINAMVSPIIVATF